MSQRPSFAEIAFGFAQLAAQRSTCPRLHTGAVITTIDNRVLATGYNGSLPGTPHCADPLIGCLVIDDHCQRTVHAEANAITQAAKYGIAIGGCYLYSLHTPCLDCTKLIISSGIKMVFVKGDYRPQEVATQLAQLQCQQDLFRWHI